jgi:uncharacterized OsmC-like protein
MDGCDSEIVVVPVEAKWLGGTLVEARMGERRLLMDAPPFEEREGKGPSATETYLAAIGRCHVMSIVKAAQTEGVTIHGVHVTLFGRIKQLHSSGEEAVRRRFHNISIDLDITTDATDDQLAKVLQGREKYSLIVHAIQDGVAGDLRQITLTPAKPEV